MVPGRPLRRRHRRRVGARAAGPRPHRLPRRALRRHRRRGGPARRGKRAVRAAAGGRARVRDRRGTAAGPVLSDRVEDVSAPASPPGSSPSPSTASSARARSSSRSCSSSQKGLAQIIDADRRPGTAARSSRPASPPFARGARYAVPVRAPGRAPGSDARARRMSLSVRNVADGRFPGYLRALGREALRFAHVAPF